VDDTTLDLWLDWGPAAFLVSVFGASYLLSTRRDGLALSIRAGAALCFVAALGRCLPVCLASETIAANRGALVALVHVCQFLNGAAAPFVVASPALLSLTWFPEGQRNAITAVANVASALGRAVGFFLGPAVATGADSLALLLVVELGLAAVPLLAAVWLLPDAPLAPPSRAARAEARRWDRLERARRRAARRAELAAAAADAAAEAALAAAAAEAGGAALYGDAAARRGGAEGIEALTRRLEAEAAEDDADERRLVREERAEAAAEAAAAAAAAAAASGGSSGSSLNNGGGGGSEEEEDGPSVSLLAAEERRGGAGATVAPRAAAPRTAAPPPARRGALAVADADAAAKDATLWGELRRALSSRSFVLLCLAGGLEMAIYGMWSGVLPAVLTALPGGAAFSDVQAGALGSVNTFAGIAGALLAGWASDAPVLRTRLLPLTAALLAASALFFAAVALPLPPLAVAALAPVARSFGSVVALVAVAGLLRGGADPLFFELAAESVAGAGVPAGTAGAVLTFFYHLVLVGLLGLPPAALAAFTLPGMALCLLLSALLLLPVRVAYTRR